MMTQGPRGVSSDHPAEPRSPLAADAIVSFVESPRAVFIMLLHRYQSERARPGLFARIDLSVRVRLLRSCRLPPRWCAALTQHKSVIRNFIYHQLLTSSLLFALLPFSRGVFVCTDALRFEYFSNVSIKRDEHDADFFAACHTI